MKLVVEHNLLPSSFYLKDVTCSDKESRGVGSFADIYLGDWQGQYVALKRPRVTVQSLQQNQAHRMVRAGLRFIGS